MSERVRIEIDEGLWTEVSMPPYERRVSAFDIASYLLNNYPTTDGILIIDNQPIVVKITRDKNGNDIAIGERFAAKVDIFGNDIEILELIPFP